MPLSDEELDALYRSVSAERARRRKSPSERRLESLEELPSNERTVDDRMEIDRLSDSVSESKRDDEFSEGWDNTWTKI